MKTILGNIILENQLTSNNQLKMDSLLNDKIHCRLTICKVCNCSNILKML